MREYPVDLYELLFSATAGANAKAGKYQLSAKVLVDLLAANDKFLYGRAYKPQNQRRTINPGSNLFVHMPVRHTEVIKADPRRKIHLEIEFLLIFLLFKHIGIKIDPTLLKVPVHNKKDKVIELNDIDTSELKHFKWEIKDCIDLLSKKLVKMKDDKNYRKKISTINLHEDTDRRFLVMRSGCYETALEERLALAKLNQALQQIFDENPDKSSEVKAFKEFAQHCLSKEGRNDPGLEKTENKKLFYSLKTAALVKDEKFVKEVYELIDKRFTGEKKNLSIKNFLLKELERAPVEKTSEQLKLVVREKLKQYGIQLNLAPKHDVVRVIATPSLAKNRCTFLAEATKKKTTPALLVSRINSIKEKQINPFIKRSINKLEKAKNHEEMKASRREIIKEQIELITSLGLPQEEKMKLHMDITNGIERDRDYINRVVKVIVNPFIMEAINQLNSATERKDEVEKVRQNIFEKQKVLVGSLPVSREEKDRINKNITHSICGVLNLSEVDYSPLPSPSPSFSR